MPFNKLHCTVCDAKTWHYNQSQAKIEATVSCCDHNKPKTEVKVKTRHYVEHTKESFTKTIPLSEYTKGTGSGIKFKVGSQYPNSPLNNLLPKEFTTNNDPSVLRCSYCHVAVPYIVASYGSGPLRFKTEVTGNPPVEETKISSRKIIACPQCAHLIKPVKNSKGEIINNNVKTWSEG